MVTGDEISSCALDAFEKLPKNLKPRIIYKKCPETNTMKGVQEYTVLASIIMQRHESMLEHNKL